MNDDEYEQVILYGEESAYMWVLRLLEKNIGEAYIRNNMKLCASLKDIYKTVELRDREQQNRRVALDVEGDGGADE